MKTRGPENIPDDRHIAAGREIPTVNYCDQPYVVPANDGAWVCCVTTGAGGEGEAGEYVLTMRSTDLGKTWSDYAAVEPPDGPESSYAVMLKAQDTGRIYIFYNHNTDNVREVLTEPGYPQKTFKRVDSLGHFVFKFSDDHGKSWSRERHEIPVRDFQCDRANVYGGKLKFFWNVGRPFMLKKAVYVPLHKIGAMGEGGFAQSEGALLRSPNLLTERDPEKIVWETLPDGEVGLRAPQGGGRIAEEQSFAVMSDGSIYCVYRSVDGYPVESYSRDSGRTWTEPVYKKYADGRAMKNPRAANFAWRCLNGKYLYWYHNHGGNFIRRDFSINQGYYDRNPVWLCAGEEVESQNGRIIRWSQPEIVLYDDDPYIGMSYPDLIEEGGAYYLTETEKYIARVHKIDTHLINGLFSQFENRGVARDGVILELGAGGSPVPPSAPMPLLPKLTMLRDKHYSRCKDLRAGFSLEVRFKLDRLAAWQVLLDNRTAEGNGFCLRATEKGTLEIILGDGRTENRWECDPDMLGTKREHHAVVIVDGGPKLILFVVDGILCDGGEYRQFGWGRYNPNLRTPQGGPRLKVGNMLEGNVSLLRMYGRALRVSEAIGNWRSGTTARGRQKND